MRCERLRPLLGTLRFRLTAWTCGVVFLTVALTLVGVREGVRRSLLFTLDEQLREDVEEIGLTVKAFRPDREKLREELAVKARGHAGLGWFAQTYALDGNLVWSTDAGPELDLPVHGSARVSLATAGAYRVAQVLLKREGQPPRVLRIGASLALVEQEVRQLTDVLLLAGGAVLIVIPLIAYWLAGRATRPLAQIIATASRLRPSSLDDRLPLRHTGDELDQLSETINGLLDRIAAYLEQNRDFLANAAHELRSPLAAIRTSLEVALDSERTVKEYVALLGDIAEECNDLGVLVNQLLVLAEGETGQLSTTSQTVRLDRVVQQSLEMFQGVAESQQVALTAPRLAPLQVRGDKHHLRQVVNNLIDNAVKFTPAEGRVIVDLGVDESGASAVLRVADNGIGIAPEHLPRIFERFFRCDRSRSREASRKGNGLGLSICDAIVKSLGGRIMLKSILGRGSEFSVLLPLAQRSDAAPGNASDQAASSAAR